jgi:methanogenic corrinoid protein MtbC1
MADTALYKNKEARQAFIAKGKEVFERIRDELEGQEGVVAIEPESGEYFVGKTLGAANDAALAKFSDVWMYFVRLDDPEAAMPLKTW